MRKEKNGFISNPTMLVALIIFTGLASCLLILMIILGFDQILNNVFLILIIVLSLSFIFFFLLLIKRFTYRICFNDKYLFQYKDNKLLNKFNINDIKMSFINPKYGYVNIEGITIEGLSVILSFEYSKNRGNIIKRYYAKEIENLPERYK